VRCSRHQLVLQLRLYLLQGRHRRLVVGRQRLRAALSDPALEVAQLPHLAPFAEPQLLAL
jgi:hypothetical protein